MRISHGLLALLIACVDTGPGQLVIHVTTDAPLPRAAPTPDDPGFLFDTFRIEVVDAEGQLACDRCVREVAPTHESLRDDGVSFGVVPGAHEGPLFVRARMFLRAHLRESEPDPRTTVERVVMLGEAPSSGATHVTIVLPVDALGVPIGTLSQPDLPVTEPPLPALVGSWPGARRVPCSGPAGPEEVCVPGGAYWMGDPRTAVGTKVAPATGQPRLVILSPYFLDREEVSVRAMRDVGVPLPALVLRWSGSMAATAFDDHCTFTDVEGPWEDRPVNCLHWGGASAHCEAVGKRLPTEAEFEFVARGETTGSLHSSGNSVPTCDEMVVNGAPSGYFSQYTNGVCPWSSAQPPGTSQRDVVLVGGSEAVLDLGGNVSEWVADKWNREDEPCWAPLVLSDPLCDGFSSDGSFRTIKGGNWVFGDYAARAATKLNIGHLFSDYWPLIGFRCARSDL